jgi:RND family efflux transporter MFP subunit
MKLSPALLCALFGLLAAGCGRQAAPAAAGKTEAAPRPEAAPLAVRTAAAEQRSVERSIVATGSLLPDDTVTISSEVQGRVAKIHYDFGQSVRQGAVLVELDPTEYDLQIERARAALNQALARLGLPAYAGKMSPPESTPALRQVLAQLEDTRFKYESAAKLVKTGDVSQERFTEAEKAYRARQAAVELARDEMRVAWMSVTALEADLRIVQKRRNDTVVRAPFDAEVGEKVAAVGQFVKDNTPLIRLVKTNPLRLRAEIPEAASSAVPLGTRLTFTTDALPGAEFTAVVRQRNPALDARSRTLSVEARLERGDARLRPGMFVQVKLVTQAAAVMVAVPRQALYSVAGLTKLFVIENGAARLVTFTPGLETDGWVEVPDGAVKPGDRVAVSELGTLTNGTKVRM